MAWRLYPKTAPEVFAIPNQTMAWSAPWGGPYQNGVQWSDGGVIKKMQVVGATKSLPAFALTDKKPANGYTSIHLKEYAYPVAPTYPSYPPDTWFRNYYLSPVCQWAMGFSGPKVVNPTDWVRLYSASVPGYLAVEWSPRSFCRNSLGALQYVWPAVAYVWRPSTSSVVGFVWSTLPNVYSSLKGSTWGLENGQYGAGGSYLPANYYHYPSCGLLWDSSNSVPGCVYTGYSQSVTAAAGDVLVIEWWVAAEAAYTTGDNATQDTLEALLAMGVGTDQPGTTGGFAGYPTYTYQEANPTHSWYWDFPSLSSLDYPLASPTTGGTVVTLTRVDPNAAGLEVTFDNPVVLASPVGIGPSAGGLAVGSVTDTSETVKQVNLFTQPEAPVLSVTSQPGPETPSGGAVSDDPAPAVPVAGAWRE